MEQYFFEKPFENINSQTCNKIWFNAKHKYDMLTIYLYCTSSLKLLSLCQQCCLLYYLYF